MTASAAPGGPDAGPAGSPARGLPAGVEPTLDHLVHAVPDLDAAVRDLGERCGVRPVEGGRHVGLGTRNVLLGLGGRAYLEIIGPDTGQPAPPHPRPFGIDRLTAPALVTWAVHPADLDAAAERARSLGHDPGEARGMSRRTPAGDLLRWRLTPDRGLLPFLIDWGGTPHPTSTGLPAVALLELRARHPDPPVLQRGLDALGVRLAVGPGERPELIAVLRGPGGDVTLR